VSAIGGADRARTPDVFTARSCPVTIEGRGGGSAARKPRPVASPRRRGGGPDATGTEWARPAPVAAALVVTVGAGLPVWPRRLAVPSAGDAGASGSSDGRGRSGLERRHRQAAGSTILASPDARPARPHRPAVSGAAVVTTLEHWPDRRSWGCRACGEPWPCDQARKNLADDPTVAIYMSIQLHVACSTCPRRDHVRCTSGSSPGPGRPCKGASTAALVAWHAQPVSTTCRPGPASYLSRHAW
jgi:hypothetical protein